MRAPRLGIQRQSEIRFPDRSLPVSAQFIRGVRVTIHGVFLLERIDPAGKQRRNRALDHLQGHGPAEEALQRAGRTGAK